MLARVLVLGKVIEQEEADDTLLRSAKDVMGYYIEAMDGDIAT
jgi:hypothetical protein